jgi:hypothetical protein
LIIFWPLIVAFHHDSLWWRLKHLLLLHLRRRLVVINAPNTRLCETTHLVYW